MIRQRLQRVRRMVLVLSGKGGVGKSVISSTFAALLHESGRSVGLMDADIYGPSSALLLGANARPREGKQGLTPCLAAGVKVMSVDLFAPGRAVPLAGSGARQVMLEMLALTNWGRLDYLIVDMPPATSDIMMTLTSLDSEGLEAIVVTMPDRLSVSVASRVLELLRAGRFPISGVVGNMYHEGSRGDREADSSPEKLARKFSVKFLGRLPYDEGVSRAVEEGDVKGMLQTQFARALRRSMKGYLATAPIPG